MRIKRILFLASALSALSSFTAFAEVKTWDLSKEQNGRVVAEYDTNTKVFTFKGTGPMDAVSHTQLTVNPSAPRYTSYLNAATSIRIENGITSIGQRCFYEMDNPNIDTIVIPSTVENIDCFAFEYANIKDIVIPDNVTRIGYKAFSRSKVENVVFEGSNITYSCEHTDDTKTFYVFDYCAQLATVKLPDKLTKIPANMFKSCKSLKSIELPNSILEIGSSAFHTTGLLELRIPASVTEYNFNVTSSCSNLTDIYIPASVVKLSGSPVRSATVHVDKDSYAHWYCHTESIPYELPDGSTSADPNYPDKIIDLSVDGDNSVVAKVYGYHTVIISGSGVMKDYSSSNLNILGGSYSDVIIEDGVTNIGSYVIQNMPDDSIIIPETVTHIGNGAFYNCNNLKTINLPNNLKSLGSAAFASCDSLESLHIPASVTECGGNIVRDCPSLTEFRLPTSYESGTIDVVGENCPNLDTLYISAGSTFNVSNWADNPEFQISNVVIEEGAKIVPRLYAGTGLTTVDIPDSVIEIADDAFKGSGLREIHIPDSVLRIGAHAFSNISTLTVVDISETSNLEEIDDYAFMNMSAKQINIPPSVKKLGDGVFLSNPGVEVFFRNKTYAPVEGVYEDLFDDTWYVSEPAVAWVYRDSATHRNIGSTLGHTNSVVFKFFDETSSGNPWDVSVSQDKSVMLEVADAEITITGTGAMKDFPNTEVAWKDYKDTVTSVTIADGVTSIGNNVFNGFTNLNIVNVPDSITTVGNDTFDNCPRVDIHLNNGAPSHQHFKDSKINHTVVDGDDTLCKGSTDDITGGNSSVIPVKLSITPTQYNVTVSESLTFNFGVQDIEAQSSITVDNNSNVGVVAISSLGAQSRGAEWSLHVIETEDYWRQLPLGTKEYALTHKGTDLSNAQLRDIADIDPSESVVLDFTAYMGGQSEDITNVTPADVVLTLGFKVA